MGVYIKGMEMPTSCYKCNMRRRDGMDIVCPIAHERFSITDVNILEYRLDNCPLVPVPEHGRLIDADALVEFIENLFDITWDGGYAGGKKDACVAILERMEAAPTIIPAEQAEEGE